jgi:DNA-directed RNA polymerase subunit RPC12/RpoP
MLSALRDALSGGPLDPDAELFRCADCQSFYTVASVRALALDNGARCINCGSMHRIGVEVMD